MGYNSKSVCTQNFQDFTGDEVSVIGLWSGQGCYGYSVEYSKDEGAISGEFDLTDQSLHHKS